jgi:hypothetical protein
MRHLRRSDHAQFNLHATAHPVRFSLLHRWLAEPHVLAWWHEPIDLHGIEAKYGPRIDGIEPTHVFAIEYHHRPVGWIQWYRWSDYQEHAQQLRAELESAGIDLAIGERELLVWWNRSSQHKSRRDDR